MSCLAIPPEAPRWFRGLPAGGAGLDFIKICAAVFMVIDHIDHILFDYTVFEMYLIGRGTFPLFCFAAACAILRATPDQARGQCLKLLFLAVLVEPVSILTRGPLVADMPVNVIFTLAAGTALCLVLPSLPRLARHGVFALGLASVLLENTVEFGLMGVMLVPALFMVLRGDKTALPWVFLFLATINAGNLWAGLAAEQAFNWKSPLLAALAATILPFVVLDIAREIKSQKRLLSRYALHVFYPGHLALLGLLRAFLR